MAHRGDRLTIGMVARQSGLTRDTIRYYERLGLLPKPPRSNAGYRQYGNGVVNRLTLIRNAQTFGFSLRQIASFLKVRDTGGKPCDDVRQAGDVMLAAVDRQIQELVARRDRIRDTLQSWDRKLAATASDQRAHLLETL